jgi:hypothetical protein
MNKLSSLFTVFTIIICWSVHSSGQEHNYVGAIKCKKCHKKEKRGNQYQKWLDGPHAKAYETLAKDTAKIVAKSAGIKGHPQKSDKCLKCHVTAFGVDKKYLDSTFSMEMGVQCEACHGPGSDYKKKKIMKDRDKAISLGLIISEEELCRNCHNEESPTYKEFDFEKFKEKIAHPLPDSLKHIK